MKLLGYQFSLTKTPKNTTNTHSPRGSARTNPDVIQFVQSFKDASRKDIAKWRSALSMALHPETPKNTALYDLIDDLLTDGHLQSQIQMRKMSTLNTDFHLINRKTGEIEEEATFVFQQQWFYEFLSIALDSILFGATLVEFSSFEGEKIRFNTLSRRHVIPVLGRILPDVTKEDYINYRDEYYAPWLLQIGKADDLGLINNIVPNLIWKRNVAQSWAEFCEKFGMPLITATSNSTNSDVVDKVNQMLLDLGEAGVATFPQGTSINFQEANRTDTYNVYMQFMQVNTNEISKQLVGSTMLSDQGTNRSQTEVHERSLDFKIAQADKRFIQFVVNDQLIPLLRLQGYKLSDEVVFEFKTAEQEINLSEMWNITNGLLSSGYKVETEWISKTFNIPIESEGKSQPLNEKVTALLRGEEENERYPFSCTCGQHTALLGKTIRTVLAKLTDKLIGKVYHKKDTLPEYAQMVVAEGVALSEALRNNFPTISPYTGPDQLCLQMMEYNLFEFAAGKTESRLASMKRLLVDENNQIRPFSEFKELCQKEVEKFNKKWLEAEYNLSIAVGQNSAQYLRFMAEKDTVTSFVKYQTAGDDKVREAHKVLNGKIFNLSDKEAMDLYPPNGYGCRCEMVQVLGEQKGKVTKGREAKMMLEGTDSKYRGSQFEINRGDLKQVFTKQQFYSDTKGLPKKLNEMTFDKYGLPSWEAFKQHLNPLKLDSTITEKNIHELFKPFEKNTYMGFEDYLGRKLTLQKATFDKHTQGYYLGEQELRHQLFPFVKDILMNPDEVWYFDFKNNAKKFQPRYIKFYQDRVLVIDCDLNIEEQSLTINTWYSMKADEKTIRKGLKIK